MGSSHARPLARIRNLTKQLNDLSDEAASAVKNLEDTLAEAQVGTPAWVTVFIDEEHEGLCYETRIGYARVGRRFRIAVVELVNGDPDSGEAKAWAECNQKTKLETIEALPELLEKIATEVERKILGVANAVLAAQTFVENEE